MKLVQLAQKFREHVAGARIRIGVAVDGSRVSEKAWQTALHFHSMQEGSEVFVLHVTHASKTYLPQHLSATHIKHEYTTAFIKHKLPQAEFHSVEREPGESTCHALTRLAEHLNIDFLFVGSYGRKKGDYATGVCDSDVHVLGSVADHALRISGVHVCIVRSTSYAIEESSRFLIPVDLSDNSGYAVLTALEHLVRPSDIVHVLALQSEHRDGTSPSPEHGSHCITDDDLAEYRKVLEEWGGTATVQVQTVRRGMTIAEGILEVGISQEVDFILMGIAGNDDKSVGSVTDAVSKGARCTTFAIKNPFRVFKDRLIGAHSLFEHAVAPDVQRHLIKEHASMHHPDTDGH